MVTARKRRGRKNRAANVHGVIAANGQVEERIKNPVGHAGKLVSYFADSYTDSVSESLGPHSQNKSAIEAK